MTSRLTDAERFKKQKELVKHLDTLDPDLRERIRRAVLRGHDDSRVALDIGCHTSTAAAMRCRLKSLSVVPPLPPIKRPKLAPKDDTRQLVLIDERVPIAGESVPGGSPSAQG